MTTAKTKELLGFYGCKIMQQKLKTTQVPRTSVVKVGTPPTQNFGSQTTLWNQNFESCKLPSSCTQTEHTKKAFHLVLLINYDLTSFGIKTCYFGETQTIHSLFYEEKDTSPIRSTTNSSEFGILEEKLTL